MQPSRSFSSLTIIDPPEYLNEEKVLGRISDVDGYEKCLCSIALYSVGDVISSRRILFCLFGDIQLQYEAILKVLSNSSGKGCFLSDVDVTTFFLWFYYSTIE